MTTQPLDLKKLREVADRATPGPWSRLSGKLRPQFSLCINEIHGPDEECLIRWNGFDGVDTNKRQTDVNAKFIATFNPKTILALLDAYEAIARDAELWRGLEKAIAEDLAEPPCPSWLRHATQGD